MPAMHSQASGYACPMLVLTLALVPLSALRSLPVAVSPTSAPFGAPLLQVIIPVDHTLCAFSYTLSWVA